MAGTAFDWTSVQAPLDVVFTDFDVVEPDLSLVSKNRVAAVLRASHVTGAPAIVGRSHIGIDAQAGRDHKRRLYERSGVSEYWIADPDLDVVRVYRNCDERFERPVMLRAEDGDILTTPHLDGLDMPLSRIFTE